MSQIHGIATIRRNGNFIETFDDASIIPGGVKNNSRASATRYNHNQTYLPATVKCKIPVNKQMSLTELQGASGMDITFESDIGKTFIVRNAAQTGDLELTGGSDGGTVEATFEGDAAEEMVV